MHHRRHARYGMPKLPVRSEHPSQTGDVLIPGSQRMQAANKSGIHILGAILLELSLPDSDAVTKQKIYVTPNVIGLILSKFPSISAGAVSNIPLPQQPELAPTVEVRKCGCPTRSLPPPGPFPLPVPATEENGHLGTAPAGDIQRVHIQHMYPPTSSHDGRPASTAEYRPESEAHHSTQGCRSAHSLGGEGQSPLRS